MGFAFVLGWWEAGGIGCEWVAPPPAVQGGYRYLAGGPGFFAAVQSFPGGDGVSTFDCERGTSWCGGNFYKAQQILLVVVGFRHYCVLLASGRVDCQGEDSFGQLRVPAVAGGFASLSIQSNCTCGITSVGHKVMCWGSHAVGGAASGAADECSVNTLPDRAYRQVTVLNYPYNGICGITDPEGNFGEDGDSRILCSDSVRRYVTVPTDRFVTQLASADNQGACWF